MKMLWGAARFVCRQNWIRFGLRYRIAKWAAHPKKIGNHPFAIKFFGYRYQGNLNSHIDWYAYFFGAFEISELALLRDVATKLENPVMLDIGANIGHHSLFMSGYCKEIHAFEPFAGVRKSLEQKINDNDLKNIFVHPIALGTTDEEKTFYPPATDNQGTGSFVVARRNESIHPLKLSVRNGDAYLAEKKIEHVGLIKLDVEGFEPEVLEGLRVTLQKDRPIIMMELSAYVKNRFGNLDGLMAAFPENYTVKRIIDYRNFLWFFNIAGYTLADLTFNEEHDCNVIFMPNEKSLGI